MLCAPSLPAALAAASVTRSRHSSIPLPLHLHRPSIGDRGNNRRWSAAPKLQALAARRRRVKALLSQRRLPEQGWDEPTIEMLLQVGCCALRDLNCPRIPGARS